MLARLAARWEMLKQDRGEGPIPHVVMIAMMVTVAIAVGGLLLTLATDWVGNIDDAP